MAQFNYVKFQRGSATSYNNLANKDNNTLYFIYNDNDPTIGSLYLGDRLINSNIGSSDSLSLSNLTDILITNAQTGDFLILNSEKKWINVSAAQVAQIIMTANPEFSLEIDENQFEFSAVNGKLELKGFTNASAGLIPIKGQDNKLNWTQPPVDLSAEVGNLTQELNQVKNDLAAVDGKIASVNHLSYKIVGSLDAATANNVVYLIENQSGESNNQYDEFMVIDGTIEKLGIFGTPNLSNYATIEQLNQKASLSQLQTVDGKFDNYVTTTVFNATIGDLSKLTEYNDLSQENLNIANTFEDIYDRLIWQDIKNN